MNKTELINHIADEADISKAAAARALDAVTDAITRTLKKGGTAKLGLKDDELVLEHAGIAAKSRKPVPVDA